MDGPADGRSRPVRLAAQDHLAPAKINLALHVTGRRADGYHLLSSLVAFADIGDRLTTISADADTFRLRGTFADVLAASLAGGPDNSVLAALRLVRGLGDDHGIRVDPLRILLEKNLPVASGIGGGSADAAAVLRLAIRALPELGGRIREAAVRLGADVPMCIDAQAAIVSGIGEAKRDLSAFPPLPAVLVNPGVPVSTPAVFAALTARDSPPLPEPFRFGGLSNMIGYLRAARNDLEAPAVAIAPVIADAAAALEANGSAFARMSGSGATVFGLFASRAAAERAATSIAAAYAGWWVRPTVLGSVEMFEP